MKKIIQINLSGRAISIEEPAYEKLQQYIQQLRQHFASEESKEEILNDIEGRISELLQEKLQRGLDAITETELEEVIASIGRPEDFSDANELNAPTGPTQATYQQKRLYRDTDDKILGGVCSGIASYFGIDPTIVRLLFAIITFGGFGTGFLIYIALWILLPKQSLRGQSARRLYRNPDDRMLGGVASGLAAYFHVPVRNLRLIFAAPILVNMILSLLDVFDDSIFVSIGFGSLTGTFVLAYIILWIILPEASTTYQKMEMRGEKVDLNRIKQNVKEGFDRLEGKITNWGSEVEQTAQQLSEKFSERSKGFSEVRSTSRNVLHAIGSVIRFFIYLFLGTVAFALLVSGAAILFAGFVTLPAQEFFWTSKMQQWGFWITVFLFFIVPVLFLFIWLIRRLFHVRRKSPVLRWSFGILWTLGWIALFWTGISVIRDFEHKVKNVSDVTISSNSMNTLTIDQSAPPFEYTGTWQWINGDPQGFDITRDTFKIPAVQIKVEKSPDTLFHVRVIRFAWGRNPQQAQMRLDKFDYPVSLKDSMMDVAPGIVVGKEEKYRGQHVELWVQVPAGKSVRFTDAALKNKSWAFQSDSLYIMEADGDLSLSAGNRVL
ncbi:MAG: PspC domain-containing protein [Bacteroidota bacterium]|jgi:phage shock protein PspC (stress-responsive transcriptional regulator)